MRAISDISGAVKNDAGLDIPSLEKYVQKTGGVKGFPGGDEIDANTVLFLDCDVLIPAALGGVLHKLLYIQLLYSCIFDMFIKFQLS